MNETVEDDQRVEGLLDMTLQTTIACTALSCSHEGGKDCARQRSKKRQRARKDLTR
jgi:hypothetical protein